MTSGFDIQFVAKIPSLQTIVHRKGKASAKLVSLSLTVPSIR